jgi:hypothetical protein
MAADADGPYPAQLGPRSPFMAVFADRKILPKSVLRPSRSSGGRNVTRQGREKLQSATKYRIRLPRTVTFLVAACRREGARKMVVEPTSSHEMPRARPQARPVDLPDAGLCPCGAGSLDRRRGHHVICPTCREKLERHVRRRFGAHRYGGRYAAEVPDIVQDCYQKLLAPGGLDSFQPAPGRESEDAFGGWLWRVVHNHCNNKVHYLRVQPAVGSHGLDSVPESHDAVTPEQAFARMRIRELSEGAVGKVAPKWSAKGPAWRERFDVILELVYEKEPDAKRARDRLGITDENLRKLKHELIDEMRLASRAQIREDLLIEAGLTPDAVELMIDHEIEAMFQAAYPGSSPSACLAAYPRH